MIYKAGFDLSEISIENWNILLNWFNLNMSVQTEKGWCWYDNEDNFVMTANNPVTGYYYHDRNGTDKPVKGYVGYVGIEGNNEFVTEFYHCFMRGCNSYKEAVFGSRPFI
jgi:hypothetical protein